ncbi:hypothetical protein ABZP36_032701 [Zizania latifolia]
MRSEVACVNSRLAAYHTKLRMMKNLCDSLHSCIDGLLELKRKGDEQSNWRVSKAKDINELKDQLAKLKRQTLTDDSYLRASQKAVKSCEATLQIVPITMSMLDHIMVETADVKDPLNHIDVVSMLDAHTLYIGHLKERRLKDQMEKDPTEVICKVVPRMLPCNRLCDVSDT